MSRGDKQAFPLPGSYAREGMTLREYYAGLAMQGYLSGIVTTDIPDSYDDEPRAWREHTMCVARLCCNYADALLAALEAKKP